MNPFSAIATILSGFLILGNFAHAASTLPTAATAAPEEYASLLEKYVAPDGVRYAKWKADSADMQRLDAVVSFFANTLPPTDRSEALAWHINAYNAWILHRLLAKFPTNGPMDGDEKFFDQIQIVVAGDRISFNQLESDRIRKRFGDPRIHFAVNCASRSCPPLDARPFSGATLDADLDRVTREFLSRNPEGIAVSADGKRAEVTRLFDWYTGDFGGAGKVVEFINQHRQPPLSGDAAVSFRNYDWTLNAASQ